MKEKLIRNEIVLKPSHIHGLGVFAEKSIKNGDIVEECPYIPMEAREEALSNYYFGIEEGVPALLTGYGLHYNHSNFPNLEFSLDKGRKLVVFTACRNIKMDEELFISYGKKWFSSRHMKAKEHFKWRALLNYKNSIFIRAFLASVFVFGVVKLLVYFK